MKQFSLPIIGLSLALCCGFTALPLEDVANRSRTDRVPHDGKGGWLDSGSNDLSVLPSGRQVLAGVPFDILPAGDENARNCLVLGRHGAEEIVWTLAEGPKESRLYLLHAAADTRPSATVGALDLKYADGSIQSHAIRVGKEVGDWMIGRGNDNAARAWSEYNGAAQASLYVSSFPLKAKTTLAGLVLRATGKAPWMIVAATAADRLQVRPLSRCLEITDTCRAPEPPAKPLVRFKPGARPKNVILIIGDGMGQGAARITSYYKYGVSDGLFFDRFPVGGLCSTLNVQGMATDSSAAATAFATGNKTSNGRLGMLADGVHSVTSIAVRAKARGFGVALVTSDTLVGATPSGFYAHVPGRGDKVRISEQAAESGFDVLIGSERSFAGFRPKANGGLREDGRDLLAEMSSRGYAIDTTQDAMDRVPAHGKVAGGLRLGTDVAIADAMRAAIALLKDNAHGLFMMAECSDTDGGGHGNDPSLTVRAVTMVEFMAKAAVDFASERDDTLVIVTADHETGGALVVRGGDGRMTVDYMTTSHSAMPVPIHAYGPGAERFEGLVDNTDIAKNIAALLGL